MSQSPPGWNSYFHRNNAYDTSHGDGNNSPSIDNRSNRNSLFRLRDDRGYDYDHSNNIPLNLHGEVRDVENPFTSKEETSRWETSHDRLNNHPLPLPPSAPGIYNSGNANDEVSYPRSPPTPSVGAEPLRSDERYGDRPEETDEEMARRLYNEEKEGYYRPPENRNYPGGDLNDRSSGSIPLIDPKAPKALQDPNVIRQLRKQKEWRPWFIWVVTVIQVIVLIVEFVNNRNNTGSLIQTSPLNPMIGPSPETLILMGARFAPCMRTIPGITNLTFQCPFSNQSTCTLEDICGFGGFHGKPPDQWYRFFLPIFIHGGLVHIVFNMLFQVVTGSQVERGIGFPRFSIIYLASGTFGFIFGGNFAAPGVPSMGASGSLFGVIGILLLDLVQNWKLVVNPCWELTKMLLMIGISFLLGLLPGLDNFSHIGGFVMGLVTGLILMPTISFSKLHKRTNLILRIVAIPIAIMLFALLITNFYSGDPEQKCHWCKYLSCLPINGWCDNTGFQTTTTTNNN